MTARIDYDKIAPVYDERPRDHKVDVHLLAWLERPGLQRAPRVLDIGCGTGKQLSANRRQLPAARLIGVDRSRAMLRIARNRCSSVDWIQGDGTALPVRSGSIDYVCCQFVHAHLASKRDLVREVHRALAPGGRFLLVNIDPWPMSDWILYRYFPAARVRDHADFGPVEGLVEEMRAAGFPSVEVIRDVREEVVDVGTFHAFASTRHRASQLTAIADGDYQEGLRKLADRVSQATGPVEERSTYCLVTYLADKR